MKKTVLNAVLALVCGTLGAYVFTNYMHQESKEILVQNELKGLLTSYNGNVADANLSFVLASKVSTPSVVFIKTTAMMQQRNPFGMFFDGWDPFGSIGQVSSTGSGVIVRKDGYIVTNLHVVKDAQNIEVVLNNKKENLYG